MDLLENLSNNEIEGFAIFGIIVLIILGIFLLLFLIIAIGMKLEDELDYQVKFRVKKYLKKLETELGSELIDIRNGLQYQRNYFFEAIQHLQEEMENLKINLQKEKQEEAPQEEKEEVHPLIKIFENSIDELLKMFEELESEENDGSK